MDETELRSLVYYLIYILHPCVPQLRVSCKYQALIANGFLRISNDTMSA